MQINDKWKVEADSRDIFLLNKETKTRPWKRYGYYATLHNALVALVNQEVRDADLVDLRTIIDKLDSLYDLIRGLPPVTPKDIVLVGKSRIKEQA